MYSFTDSLTAVADPSLTTVEAMYTSEDNRTAVANDVFIFILAGGEPGVTCQVVASET